MTTGGGCPCGRRRCPRGPRSRIYNIILYYNIIYLPGRQVEVPEGAAEPADYAADEFRRCADSDDNSDDCCCQSSLLIVMTAAVSHHYYYGSSD